MTNITIKEFRDQAGWRTKLNETFKHHDGVLTTAIGILRNHAIIIADAPVKAGVHPDASNLQEFMRVKGWNQALKALEAMCLPMPSGTDMEKLLSREPWSDYAAPDSELLKNAPPKPETYFKPE